MDHLTERLRLALRPHYELESELGSGGMGIVYRATDFALRRPVAIKVLRPELATAVHTAQFLREGRILARLSHPNVITVYQAGEADGLLYFAMEYALDETLADRLARGPLPESEVLLIANDLLAGIQAAHELGIIHRDLKPRNVLLRPGRAMIGDFGIALLDRTTTENPAAAPTAGTPAYMAPEQLQGAPATEQSDLYALALVLYEAATGRQWVPGVPPDRRGWRDVPARLAGPLRRALAVAPGDRWPDAAAFRAALGGTRTVRRGLAGAGAVGLLGIAAALWLLRTDLPAGAMPLHLAPFSGPSEIELGVLDDGLRNRLGANHDLALVNRSGRARVILEPRIVSSDGGTSLVATLRGPGFRSTTTVTAPTDPSGHWAAALDALADRVLYALYSAQADLDPWLPRGALPTTPQGIQAWFRGERAYNRAQWDEAFLLYRDAVALDSTCLLCLYRLNDVERWLGRGASDERLATLSRHQDRFPEPYRALIRGYATPPANRYDSLKAVAARHKDFAMAFFAAGDEAFHRAALHGHPRREATELLLRTVRLKPGFAPGWEHLAWLGAALGDSALTRSSLDSLRLAPVETGFSAALHQLLRLGFAWRFQPEAAAREATERVLALPGIWNLPDVAAGARALMTMGSPAGAEYLGRRFTEQEARPDLLRSGLLGAYFGAVGQGKDPEAAAIGEQLRRVESGLDLELFLAESALVLPLLRGDTIPRASRERIVTLRTDQPPRSILGQRLDWLAYMTDPAHLPEIRPTGDLGVLLTADSLARRGAFGRAVEMTERLSPLEPGPAPDPFFPLLLRWKRADWLEALGRPGAAARELAGYQHLQLVGLPTGAPQAGEVDWSFGPYQAWRQSRLLARSQSTGVDLCAGLAEVVHSWRNGTEWHRVRADSARQLATARGCAAS